MGTRCVAGLPVDYFSRQRYRPRCTNPRERCGNHRLSAFLVGPPLLGYLGEHYGLRSAMLVVLALVLVAAIVAKAVAKPDVKNTPVTENS